MVDLSPLQVIRDEHQKIMQLKSDDSMIFETTASIMLAAIAPALLEPIWMYFIGPPGSGKTESITPYEGCDFTMFISTLTENTLASGFRDDEGNDPSILPLLNGKVMVVPDVSPLINDNSARVMKIWGDLRDAYDGQFAKATGTTGVVTYRSRFGVIMCATGAIDSFVEEHQQLGERFLSFRVQRIPLELGERYDLAERVHNSMEDKLQWRGHFKNVVNTQMKRAKQFVLDNPGLPKIDAGTERNVLSLANYLSLLRTSPGDENVASAELPSRLVQQLITVGHAHALLDGRMEWDESDLDLIKRIGVDTFPIAKRRMVQSLFSRGSRRPFSTEEFVLRCSKMNKGLLVRTMMQYEYMKAVEFDIDPDTQKTRGYRLTKDLHDVLDATNFFKGRHMPN